MKATLDGVAFSYGKDYDIIGKEITFKVPPSGILKIYRETPTDRLVEWNEGSVLLSSDMTLAQVQQLHIIEEQQAWSKEKSIVLNDNNVWEGRFTRIGNVADPINDQDVVTKKYMENVQGGFVQANTALKDEATKQANIAINKAGEASASTAKASVSEKNAEESELLAKRWAEASDSPDNTTSKSAKTWATEAGASAVKAGTSEVNSKASETNAKNSENNAAKSAVSAYSSAGNALTSETNAKKSETNAKSSENKAKDSELLAESYAAHAERYAAYAGIQFVVLSSRVRGDDEPTYNLVENKILLSDGTLVNDASKYAVTINGVTYEVNADDIILKEI